MVLFSVEPVQVFWGQNRAYAHLYMSRSEANRPKSIFFSFHFITSLWKENIKVSVAKAPKSLINFNTARFQDLYWPTKEFPNFSEATSPKSTWPHATTRLGKLNTLKKIVRYPPSHSFRLLRNVLPGAFTVFKPTSVI